MADFKKYSTKILALTFFIDFFVVCWNWWNITAKENYILYYGYNIPAPLSFPLMLVGFIFTLSLIFVPWIWVLIAKIKSEELKLESSYKFEFWFSIYVWIFTYILELFPHQLNTFALYTIIFCSSGLVFGGIWWKTFINEREYDNIQKI